MSDSMRRFEWDDAIPGLRSDEFVVYVTDAAILDYKNATGDASREIAGIRAAPPGYVFVAAPQRRHALMGSVGCYAPEQDTEEPRSTPYVGSNVQFHRAIEPGDTVRSVTVLDRKFERAGNRFVVFHVDAMDADGEPIADYDYTCLWERGSAGRPRSSSRSASATVQDVRSRTGTVLVKSETTETIAAYGNLDVGRPDDWLSTHTNEEFARTAIFGRAVNAGVATVGYTAQWLDLVERPGILWNGGRFESRAFAPVHAGDDLYLTGERREGEGGLVYEIVAVNQSGVTAFRSVATIPGA